MTTWSRPLAAPAPTASVGTKSPCQWSSCPGVSLTKTCRPDGEAIPESIASPVPRVVSTSGQSSARARAATASTGRADRPSADARFAVGLARRLVDDDVGLAVAPPRDGLGAVPPGHRETEAVEQLVDVVVAGCAGELEERGVGAGGDGAAGADHPFELGYDARQLVLEEDQRPHRVPCRDVGVGLADHVAEHLERERAAVARRPGSLPPPPSRRGFPGRGSSGGAGSTRAGSCPARERRRPGGSRCGRRGRRPARSRRRRARAGGRCRPRG